MYPRTVQATSSQTGVALPALLSAIAGVTDVTSWLLLGGFFSAHVTGNLVVIAADVVSGRAPDIAAVLAIPVFIITTALATLVARRIGGAVVTRTGASLQSDRTVRSITTVLLGAQALLLVAAALLSFTTRASLDPTRPVAVAIGLCAVCAMAAQNAYLHLVPTKAASTAVMTGNLVAGTVATIDLLLSRGASASARMRCFQTWPLIAGFVGGCLVGAAGCRLLSDRAATIPAVLAVVLFLLVTFRNRAAGRPERAAS